MNALLLRSGVVALSIFCFKSAFAIDDASLAFPEVKIGSFASTLSALAHENRPPIFKSESAPFVARLKDTPETLAPRRDDQVIQPDDKFIVKPDDKVDYKLVIKQPDDSMAYRLIVKNPDTYRKK